MSTTNEPRDVVDALVELYVGWREACSEVHATCAQWRRAERGERSAAFAAHVAALDREAAAAAEYERRTVEAFLTERRSRGRRGRRGTGLTPA